MLRLFMTMLVVLATLTTKAQPSNGHTLTIGDQRISIIFYTPDIVRITKSPVHHI